MSEATETSGLTDPGAGLTGEAAAPAADPAATAAKRSDGAESAAVAGTPDPKPAPAIPDPNQPAKTTTKSPKVLAIEAELAQLGNPEEKASRAVMKINAEIEKHRKDIARLQGRVDLLEGERREINEQLQDDLGKVHDARRRLAAAK